MRRRVQELRAVLDPVRLLKEIRTVQQQLVAILLGWDRRLLRFRAGEVRRGFMRGDDRHTVYVFICPITGETTVAHDPPSEALHATG